MIYLDNAATGGFKPHAVYRSVDTVNKYLCANPGRSGHRLSITGAELVYDTRKLLAGMFGASPERVIFTKNCTESLNLAIFGTLKVGGHVITTVYEHNSVLRPLFHLKNQGLISLDVVCPDENQDIVSCIRQKITPKTYAIVTTSISNVTGLVLPVTEIGNLAKEFNLLYIVDGAQGGGHMPLNLNTQNVSCLALAGHKGLCGIMGSGVLIFSEDVNVLPLTFGGTGTESFNLTQPQNYPERLEAGTLNLPSIVALREGAGFVNANLTSFSLQLEKTCKKIIEHLLAIPNVKCYSTPNPAGIIAISIDNKDSGFVADLLNREYDIAVRGGFHCAPLMHKHLNTADCGLVRISLAVQNSWNEIKHLLFAIKNIAKLN